MYDALLWIGGRKRVRGGVEFPRLGMPSPSTMLLGEKALFGEPGGDMGEEKG